MRENFDELSEPLESEMKNLANHLLLFMATRPGYPNAKSVNDALKSIADVADKLDWLSTQNLSPQEEAVMSERIGNAVRPCCLHDDDNSIFSLSYQEREVVIRSLRIVGHEFRGPSQHANRAYGELQESLLT